MRTPEGGSPRRVGKHYQKELELHYLAPGAFTVISPDKLGQPPKDLPETATTFRLSPNKKRRKNASFTILAEPEISQPNSRSSSPSGRLSPFKGRGFNPTGSRLASPTGSPVPPQDGQLKSAPHSPKRSQIPTFQRRGSSAGVVFGEKVYPDPKPLAKHNDPQGLSKSLSSISTKRVHYKPPPGPRRTQNTSYRQSAYTRLSPITGSSPETVPDLPKQNQSSSPSKIPRSRSTPPSRSTSPPGSKQPSRNASRNVSRNPSRNPSRDPSPASKNIVNNVPVRNNYKNVKPKVNTFNTAKPKVPSKPQVPSSKTNTTDRQKNDTKPNYLRNNKVSPATKTDVTTRKPMARKNSKNAIEPSSNGMSKTASNNSQPVEQVNENSLSKNGKATAIKDEKSEHANGEEDDVELTDVDNGQRTTTSTIRNGSKETHSKVVDALGNIKKVDILTLPSDSTPPPSAAVPSVTQTVTKPILASDLLSEVLQDSDGEIGNYLPDARNLSSSSVSTALNRMNNTVLDSKTVLKERTISPAVRAVMRFKKGSQDRSSSGESRSGKSTEKPNTSDSTSKVEIKPGVEEQKTVVATPKSEGNGNNNGAVQNQTNIIHHNGTTNSTNNHNNNNNVKDSMSAFNNNNQSNTNNHNNNSFLNRMENVTGGGLIANSDKDTKQSIVSERKFGSTEPSAGVTVISVGNDKTKMARTVVVTDVKPIHITVREKPSSEVEGGNLIVADNTSNGLGERSSDLENVEDALPQNVCQRLSSFFKRKMTCAWCNRNPKLVQTAKEKLPTKSNKEGNEKKTVGCWNCRRKLKVKEKKEKIKKDLNLVGEDSAKKTWWSKLNLFRKGRVLDKVGPPWNQRRKAWMEKKFGKKKREEQVTGTPKRPLCGGKSCKDVLKMMFCLSACTRCTKKRKTQELDIRRTASITSKKKSLTPTLPVEDPKPKLDLSLVEHTSLMKGAIPVLPIPLAWVCLFLNVFLPGVGTVLSGLLCLCFGIPRFSQNDGARQRIGSFLIDIVIGCGQLFTVLFCLVGWGWSIWWGVIMIKIARKYKKIKQAEKLEEEANKVATTAANQNHLNKDVEKGT